MVMHKLFAHNILSSFSWKLKMYFALLNLLRMSDLVDFYTFTNKGKIRIVHH